MSDYYHPMFGWQTNRYIDAIQSALSHNSSEGPVEMVEGQIKRMSGVIKTLADLKEALNSEGVDIDSGYQGCLACEAIDRRNINTILVAVLLRAGFSLNDIRGIKHFSDLVLEHEPTDEAILTGSWRLGCLTPGYLLHLVKDRIPAE